MAPAMVTIGLRPVTTRLNVPALVLHFVQAVVCIYENGHTMLQNKVSLMSPLNDLGHNITNNDPTNNRAVCTSMVVRQS